MKHIENETLVLEYIVKYRNENSISPSIREICAGIGVKSPATVQICVDRLTDKGMLIRSKGKMRTLVPINP
jgi:repressor LexA